MSTRYFEYVNHARVPALLWNEQLGIFYCNRFADAVLPNAVSLTELIVRCHIASKKRTADSFDLGTTHFVIVPLLEYENRVNTVLAVEGRLTDLTTILHAVHAKAGSLSQIVHLLPYIVMTARPNGNIDYASRRWFEVTATPKNARDIHASVLAAIDPRDVEIFLHKWRKGIARLEPFSFEIRLATIDGARWHEVRTIPDCHDERLKKWIVTLIDVDEAINTRLALARSREHLNVLAETGRILVEELSPVRLAQQIVTLTATTIGAICLLSYESGERFRILASHPPQESTFAAELAQRSYLLGTSSVKQTTIQWTPGEERPMLLTRINGNHGSRNVLAVIGTSSDAIFNEDDMALVGEIAIRLGMALRTAVAYGRERRVAHVLQRAMLPITFPQIPGITFDVTYRVADEAALVGGDWYDAFKTPDGKIVFSIGDVAGHGLNAAVLMGHVRESLRIAALDGAGPNEALARANRSVVTGYDVMVTAFVGLLDPTTRRLEYANAGHPPPLIVTNDGRIIPLEFGDVPLGVSLQTIYQARDSTLGSADALALYTDGLIEFQHDAILGEQHLQRLLAMWATSGFQWDASHLADLLLDGSQATDDIALMLVRFQPLNQINITIVNTPQEVRYARVAIDAFLAETPLSEERRFGFLLAICEAINNAVQHGSRQPNETVRISVARDERGIRAYVSNAGKWQSPHDTSFEGGRGLPLMHMLCDELDIHTEENASTVRLFVRLPTERNGSHGTLAPLAEENPPTVLSAHP